MATLAELRDRVLAKIGMPNDGALDPALSIVIDEAINGALEFLSEEARWLAWHRKLTMTLPAGFAYAYLPAGRRLPGVTSIIAKLSNGTSWRLAGGIDDTIATTAAVGLPTAWEIAHANGLTGITIDGAGSSGAVLGDALAITTTGLVGALNAAARITAVDAGTITGVTVDAPGFGLPDNAMVTAPDVVGSVLTAIISEVEALRFDVPAAQDITLIVEYDTAVERLLLDADVCPVDDELVALWASALGASSNEWPGEPKLTQLAQRRLEKLRARNSPGFVGSMVPPDGTNRSAYARLRVR